MRTRKIQTLLLCWLILLGTMASMSLAQDYRGRIQGVVKDSSGGVIPGAEVTLVNVSTGVKTPRTTGDEGLFLFDFVEPGTYSLSAEMPGFRKFVQENIFITTRGDVTVDPVLPPGEIQNVMTVSASPTTLRFNTTSVAHTLNKELARELPLYNRNPFKSILSDAGIVATRTEVDPFNSWAANSFDAGGGTGLANEIQVDGSPVAVGYKTGYTPAPGAVEEVTVMQNAVHAEFGHSAGGVVTVVMKSGTNDWHGDLSYTHRSPSFNALQDRMNPAQGKDVTRYHIAQGNLGHPILKNKLFNFVAYEQWRQNKPSNYNLRLPTDLEKQGDFSATYGLVGGKSFVKPIYDPASTVYDPATGAVQRTAFPNNRIPAERIDPLGKRIVQATWGPNNPGDNITGANNFRGTANEVTSYKNFSDRVDWQVSDGWRVYGRVSLFRTTVDRFAPDPAWQNSEVFVPNGSLRNAFNMSEDAVWTLNPTTVVNVHFDYGNFEDDYASASKRIANGWADIWPDNPWYKPHDEGLYLSEFPRIDLNGTGRFGRTAAWYWWQHPGIESLKGSLSKQWGTHYLKTGVEQRRNWADNILVRNTNFNFTSAITANTFVSPDTRYSGDEYASLLLGYLDPATSYARFSPLKKVSSPYYAAYIQDDFKLSSRLSLNLGLRWEYYAPWGEAENRFSRYLDLDQAIPGMDAVAAKFPTEALALRNAKEPLRLTGSWLFTDAQHPDPWNAPLLNLAPKIGGGYRFNDKTALRVGFARFFLPDSANSAGLNFLEPPMPGYDITQSPEPLLSGIPRATLSDPFPAATNPLLPPKGKDYGSSLGLGGDALLWVYQDRVMGINDRVNLTVTRQLPNELVFEVTWLMNFTRHQPIMKDLNLTDPRLSYEYQGLLNQTVDNPFYDFGTAETFPGSLRTQKKVSLASLLKPYPQYGNLNVRYYPSAGVNRYNALQIRVDRHFSDGYTFNFGYNYNRTKNETFYDTLDTYLENYTSQEGLDPRHRASFEGVIDLPFGRGRQFLPDMHPILNGVLGGWRITGYFWSRSGGYLNLGQSVVVAGNPALDKSERTRERWFDTSLISKLPAYTRPSNPAYWPGLTGPWQWNLDANMSKNFRVTEDLTVQARAVAYNVLNRLQYGNPDVSFTSANFGSAVRSRANTGRQMEIELRVLF
jgi:hypothetical protein